MSDSTVVRLVQSIADQVPVQVSLTTLSGEMRRLECVYRVGTSPGFFLVFPSKNLPKDIDPSKYCTVFIEQEGDSGPPLSLNAKIEEVIGNRTLELTAKTSIDPTTLRSFFRVALYVPVTISFQSGTNPERSRTWSLSGETLDISGSGLLGLFGEECEDKHNIKITLRLPAPQAVVSCMGHVVSVRRIRRTQWHIALHFDDITGKQRDILLANCLSEQRRQLQEAVNPSPR